MSTPTVLSASRAIEAGVPRNGRAPARAREVPALALSVEEAAGALGVSYRFFHDQIECELRIVRLGRRKLIPVVELQRWLDEHARALSQDCG